MPKKVAGRKEQRKAARVAVKVRKNQSTMERQKQPVETQAEGHVNAISKKSGRAAGEKDSRVSKKEKKQLALVSKNNESLAKIADKIGETKNIESVRSIEIPSEVYNDKGPVLRAEVQ